MSNSKKLATTTTSKSDHEYTMYSTVRSTQYLGAMLDCNYPTAQSLLQKKLKVVSVYPNWTFCTKHSGCILNINGKHQHNQTTLETHYYTIKYCYILEIPN